MLTKDEATFTKSAQLSGLFSIFRQNMAHLLSSKTQIVNLAISLVSAGVETCQN